MTYLYRLELLILKSTNQKQLFHRSNPSIQNDLREKENHFYKLLCHATMQVYMYQNTFTLI